PGLVAGWTVHCLRLGPPQRLAAVCHADKGRISHPTDDRCRQFEHAVLDRLKPPPGRGSRHDERLLHAGLGCISVSRICSRPAAAGQATGRSCGVLRILKKSGSSTRGWSLNSWLSACGICTTRIGRCEALPSPPFARLARQFCLPCCTPSS